ncbi:MAG: peptide chain release factor N(5)-glutamine methyltransferase [Oscillospiraceae bacterium]|nr:peptide chain release factor N(5)-glutamine methyltransferase [Oscillospiraceae bacterium]
MVKLKALYDNIEAKLCDGKSGNDAFEARYEAQLIVSQATGADYRFTVLRDPDAEVTDEQAACAQEIALRRLNGEPLQYIFGEWDFYGLTFEVGEGVLIPRQDTETLVELVTDNYLKDGQVCADLCSGSGCIGIALSRLYKTQMHCYEKSEKAMEYLRRNIEKNRGNMLGSVEAQLADVLDENVVEAAPMFDIIVSNPPYLTAEEMKTLQKELTYEPEMALFGGEDGLYFYREILRLWTKKLKKGGLFAVEIGETQGETVSGIFTENGLTAQVLKDYCSNDRVVYGVKK